MQCGHPVINTTPLDDSRFSRVSAAAPSTLVEKVRGAANIFGEQRMVTFLFIDVVGSTTISEQVDAEAWTGIMNEVVDLVIPVIYRYEGTIARVLGDSLLVFFGAPVAHEDDPYRAVRTALEILPIGRTYAGKLQESFGIEFAIRACIHTGPVILNSIQEDLKLDFTPVDGSVDLTSRIKFAAQPMTILLTEQTHRLVHPIFDCEALGPIDVKGRSEPLVVYRVDKLSYHTGSVRGIRGLMSPMVGRDSELNALTQLCEAVRAGLGRGVIIIGEPGLGKTRLILEWRNIVEGESLEKPPLWGEGRSLSFGQGLAYHLLINLIRSLLQIPDACDEVDARKIVYNQTQTLFGDAFLDIYPYVADLLSIELEPEVQELVNLPDPQTLQTQYYRAVRELFIALSRNQPLILVLEDLHWADPSSIDILIRILPLATSESILFCLATRDERESPGWRLVNAAREMLGGSLIELPLNPLSEEDSYKMVSNLLQIESLPGWVREFILKKAEGNPLFVEEVIRMLIDRGGIIQEEGNWKIGNSFYEVEIPDNLQGLLLARIDRLPEDVKTILRVASVIGRKFPVKVLEQVLEEHYL
jgi:class 3 adenylate cyclase